MKRRLAPSFLVTTCALAAPGCHSTPDTANPLPPSTFATQTHNPPAPLPQKRKRTAPAPALDPGAYVTAWDWSASQPLNPTDAEGHTILTGSDDACYFETPAPPPTTPQPTGSRNVEFHAVDCPPDMNDPAWDTCAGKLLRSRNTGECACAPLGGNPPPPPTKNACPAEKP